MNSYKNNSFIIRLENILFNSRWLLAIPYLGLCLGLLVYIFNFIEEIYEMIRHIGHMTTETCMLSMLSLVDMAMVGNLIIMVAIGSYSIFIREIETKDMEHRPRFMGHITSANLKTKLASSLVGISSIHLLRKFIEAASVDSHITWYTISICMAIHALFIISLVVLALTDKDFFKKEAYAENH